MKTLCCCFVLLVSSPVFASTVMLLNESELIQKSDAILLAHVADTKVVIDQYGRIQTHALLHIRKSLRRANQHETVVIQVPGGMLSNGMVAHCPGSPKLKPGDLVFGFLERHEDHFKPLGLSFGLLRVHAIDTQGELRVFRETNGLSFVNQDGHAIEAEKARLQGVPLDSFVARIQNKMAQLKRGAKTQEARP